ncbi:hypothetical protein METBISCDRAFT_27165 [Metschnikowia bicuspidata]|uniref:MICOS complex subunit MIC12 n=1 Tax=Metschnikowia bicuspidata TaxID=27322 RepID=A0A4P9ZDE0_9ASCO|nr:hypothetical protein METBISCDRAFT_27165 [Metschnikowia bicuspidata]
MGNRIQGFLAGAFLTGAVTAATVRIIQGQQSVVSGLIRNCEQHIDRRIISDGELHAEQLPASKRMMTNQRSSFWETFKDIWNAEMIKGVNAVYAVNWYQLGITMDKKINNAMEYAARALSEK